MILYIHIVILFSAALILWFQKIASSTSRIKLDSNENFEINSEVKEEKEKKYIFRGLPFLIRMVLLGVLRSRKNANSKNTVYDKFYSEWGSPQLKNPKATFLVKFLHLTIIYPKDYKTVKALLCNEICTDRFPKSIIEHYCRGSGKGVLFNNGDEAKELRRYTMKTLGKLGFGKNHKMAEILNEQLTDLVENLETQIISTNNKVQVQNLFTHSVISTTWSLVGGEKFSYNDPNLLPLYENIEILANLNLTSVILAEYFSKRILLWLDIFGFGYKELFATLEYLDNYFQKYIEEKKLRLVETAEPVYFVDHFLLEMEKHKSDDKLNKIYCKEQLTYVLIDLFAAGMDTTSKYMECSLMFMALNPHVQVKVQQEIDAVIGICTPSYSTHRKRMPFTEATIAEIHRMANIIPQMPRMTNRDAHIDGQYFKKGTFISANFYFARMDESYWGDPKVFRPQRFLDSENNLIFDKVNRVLPFGAGSRACLGESVASSSIFVFFTGILQRYSFLQSDPKEFLGLNKRFVAVSHPEPFHLSFTHRNI